MFQFEMLGRGTADHSLVFSPDAGKSLELELRDTNGTVLSRGLTGGHTLSLAGYGPGDYTVRVAGSGTDVITYSLDFRGQFTAGDPAIAALDIDGDGSVNSLTDTRLVSLKSLGLPAELLEQFRAPGATRSGAEIVALIDSLADSLDIDGDGTVNSLTDTRLVSLKSLGLPAELLEQFRAPTAQRSGSQIASRVDGLVSSHSQATSSSLSAAVTSTDMPVAEGEHGMICTPVGCTQVLQLLGPPSITPNAPFEIKVDYDTVDANDQSINEVSQGIQFRLFFNSSELTIDRSSSTAFETDLEFSGLDFAPFPDSMNVDGDATTDSFFSFSWADNDATESFPGVAQPVTLVTLSATATSATSVNLVLGSADQDFSQRIEGSPLDIITAPALAIAATDAAKAEGNTGTTPFTFTVSRTGDTTATTTVNYAVSGSGANPTDTADFAGSLLPSGTVRFDANETSKLITIPVNGDTTVEPDNGFTVTLMNPVGGTITIDTAMGVIQNDDATTLAIAATDATKNERDTGSTPFTFTVTRSGDLSSATSVDFSVSGSGANMADAADFGGTLPVGTINFAATEATQVITVNVSGDTVIEADEGFTVTLSNPSEPATITTVTAMGVIQNDDATTLAIAATDAIKNEGDTGSTAFTFTVTRSGDLSSATSVDFSVSGSGANMADAADFGGTLPAGTINFAATEASQVITVNVSGDTVVEGDEGFTVTLNDASAPATISTATATGTILNDDAVPPPTLSVTATDAEKNEGNTGTTPFTFTVSRMGDTTGVTTVNYTVSGSGANPANADDFAGSALPFGTVTFNANETSKIITIPVNGDTTVESNNGFTVTLTNAIGGTVTTATAGGTIQNDDAVRQAGFTVTVTDGSTIVSESGTTDTFTVVLNVQPSSNVVFTVTSSDTTEAAVSPRQLTFTSTNWDQAQTVTVVGVIDGQVDGNQTRIITVSVDDASSDDAFDSLPDQTVSVTTLDAGFTIPVRLEVSETGTTDTFDIVLNAPPISNVVLDVFGSDSTEVTFSPTSLVFTPTNWFVPQSITVTGVDDDEFDGDQQSTITVSVDAANSDDAFDALPDQTVIVTTLDDEVGGVGASISGFVFADVNNNGIRDASENGIANVEVRLSGPVSRTTTTGPDGSYRFASLPAGSYSVSETQPLAFLDGTDTPGDGSNGTAGNDVFSNINLSGQMNLREYNFGERGLQARFISLNQFLARPSPSNVHGLVFPANGEGEASAVAFRAGGSGLVTLSAEGEATLQLFDSNLTPLARSIDGALTSELEAGKGYVLYVAAIGSSARLQVDSSTVSLLTGTIPLHNRMLTTDVDLDGSTTPIDALLIINYLNGPAAGLAYPTFMDVNGDQRVTPIDVLQVVNLLNRVGVNEVPAEGEGSPPSDGLDTVPSMRHVFKLPNELSRVSSSEGQNDGERQAGQSDRTPFAVDALSLTSDEPRERVFSAASDSESSDDDDLEAAISLIAEEVGEFWQQ